MFFRVRFGIVSGCIFGGSEPQKIGFRLKGANFHKIGVFDKSLKRAPFRGRFGRSRPSNIDETSCSKLSLFQTSFFFRIFASYGDFGSILGGPRDSKNQ